MATSGIADLGNGIGYLYKIKPSGPIVSVERNTVAGVQAMQQMGVTNAPISAQRSAYSVIQVLASGGTGSITSITINGVNQIGAPIVVTSTNVQVVAEQIADAINIYTAPGFAFTANVPYSNFAWVYVFSAPANGTAINGLIPVISSTDPGLVFAPTSFINGSNDAGVYDDQFGYQFYMYANPAATPDSLPFNAMDITRFITLRGSNTGIITINKSVNNDSLTFLQRSCDTTQVILDTQGGPTDTLAFVDTVDFVEGDIIRLRNANPARVTTLEDATVNTTVATPNIYLTDAAPFALTAFNSITLQYRYDPTLGPIWVETGRSITNNPITITAAQFNTDAGAGNLRPGARYFVSDLSTGVYIYAITSQTYEQNGVLRRYVPVNYAGCWRSNMAAPTINQSYRYNQRSYKSLTGFVGTAPDTDAVNWQLVPYTTPGSYDERLHNVLLTERSLLFVWPICQEEDGNGNCVTQSYQHFVSTGINAFDVFCWNQSVIATNYCGNYVCDAIFDVANSDGAVFNNIVTTGSVFRLNLMDASCSISKNTITGGSQVTGNNFRSFTGNTIFNGLIQNNGVGGNKAPSIINNDLSGGYIISNQATGNSASIRNNTIINGSSIQLNNLRTHGVIELNVLENISQIQNCVIINTSQPYHISNNRYNNFILEYVQYGAADIARIEKNNFSNGSLILNSVAGANNISDSTFNVCTFTDWRLFAADKCTFNNCNVSNQLDCLFTNSNITGWVTSAAFNHSTIGTISGTVNFGEGSTIEYTIDLDDPAFFAANVLTIPYAMSLGAQFNLTSISPTKTVDEIVDLPTFKQVVFYNITFGVCSITFNKVSPGSWSGNLIVGAANFTLNSDASGPSDYMTMTKSLAAINMITGGVNL